MKKMHLFALCSMAFASAVYAENVNVNAGTQDAPTSFGDSSYTKDTAVILNGTEGGSSYFKVAENITVGSIKTQEGINGDFYLNAEGKTVTIDAANVTTNAGTDIILFSNGTATTVADAIGTFSIGKGTYNVVSTVATNEADVISRIGVATNNISGNKILEKNLTIESGAVINAHTKLALSGTVGSYGSINIAGEVNTFNNNVEGTGNLIIDWKANPYGTNGGTRTQVNVLDGGSVSTGNMLMRVQSKMDVKEGATLNISDTLQWEMSSTNSGGILNSYGTTNIANVDMTPTNTGSHSGAMQLNVKGGVTTVGSITQSTYEKASVNVSAGTLNVSDSYVMDTAQLNVSGGIANVTNLAQTGGSVNVTGGTLNLTGTNTIASNTSFTLAAGATVNFKEGSNNTFGTLDADSKAITYDNLKGNINFEKDSTLNVSDTLKISNGTWDFDGNFVSTKSASGNWQSIQITGNNTEFTFGENATLTADKSRMSITNAKVIFNSATNAIKTSSFVLYGSAKLQFNTENSVISTDGKYTNLNLTTGSTATVTLKDTQKFSDVLFQGLIVNDSDLKAAQDKAEAEGKDPSTVKVSDTLATLTLDLQFENADDYVSFTYFQASYTHGDGTKQDFINVYVENFESNRIFFTDKDNESHVTVNLFDATTNQKIDFQYVAATVDGVAGYWMNAIPEPAEWAAILGAIALGLAIYRRKK